jgi:hypothetical protein
MSASMPATSQEANMRKFILTSALTIAMLVLTAATALASSTGPGI